MAWKLTKKHQHQVKLLLLQPAYEAAGWRARGLGINADKSKAALDIVVVNLNSSKTRSRRGSGSTCRGADRVPSKCNLNTRNIWTRPCPHTYRILFDCMYAQVFKNIRTVCLGLEVYGYDFSRSCHIWYAREEDDDRRWRRHELKGLAATWETFLCWWCRSSI